MSLKSLEDRIERLEKVRGVHHPSRVITIHLIKGDGTEELRTAEEEAALEAYREKLRRDAEGTPSTPLILWTRKQAQELLAGQDTSSKTTLGEKEGKA
jgi:hypothetical protein